MGVSSKAIKHFQCVYFLCYQNKIQRQKENYFTIELCAYFIVQIISKLFGHFQLFWHFFWRVNERVKIDRHTYSCLLSLYFVFLFFFVSSFVWVSLTSCEYKKRARREKRRYFGSFYWANKHMIVAFLWRFVRWTFWAVLLNRPLIKKRSVNSRIPVGKKQNKQSQTIKKKKSSFWCIFLVCIINLKDENLASICVKNVQFLPEINYLLIVKFTVNNIIKCTLCQCILNGVFD